MLFYVYTGILKLEDIESETSAFMALHQRLEEELRAAKRAQLSCGEVLLPPDLLHRIAHDVLKMAESEPCGLRWVSFFFVENIFNTSLAYLLETPAYIRKFVFSLFKMYFI